MLVCTCDFILFPVLWAVLHAIMHSTNITQWQPLTLQGAGLFHIAMGAVLGLAAFGRTQEKIAGANNGGAGAPALPSNFGASAIPPAAPSFSAPAAAPSFSAPSFPAAKPAPSFAPAASTFTSSTGKLGPAPAEEPEI